MDGAQLAQALVAVVKPLMDAGPHDDRKELVRAFGQAMIKLIIEQRADAAKIATATVKREVVRLAVLDGMTLSLTTKKHTRANGSTYWLREHDDFFGYFDAGTSYKAGDRVWYDERGWIACSDTEMPPGPETVWRPVLTFWKKGMVRRFVAQERVFIIEKDAGFQAWLCLKPTSSAPAHGDNWQLLGRKEN